MAEKKFKNETVKFEFITRIPKGGAKFHKPGDVVVLPKKTADVYKKLSFGKIVS